jgi:hypothetical protein
MKKNKSKKATVSVYTTLQQIVQLIPRWMIPKIANDVGVDTRGFSVTSHIVSLLFGQLAHTFSLNEICDACAIHEKKLTRIRDVSIPKRNTLSNANRTRNPEIASRLYWNMVECLSARSPSFTKRGKHRGFLHRVKRNIYAIDSTVLRLTLACIDWAKHRRHKAAAKMHVRLEVGSFIPSLIVIERASHHDSTKASILCKGISSGDIVVADKAYIDFAFLYWLDTTGVFFVLRAKENMSYRVVGQITAPVDNIIEDSLIELDSKHGIAKYPKTLRLLRMNVEVDSKMREMTFLTNKLDWAARTIAELYKARWDIESFFKELKQTLQLSDFIGTNENAVRWQIWIAMLAHLLLHYIKYKSRWKQSFSRLVGIVRSAIWIKGCIVKFLIRYGTAGPPRRPTPAYKQLYLQGFEPYTSTFMGQHIAKT